MNNTITKTVKVISNTLVALVVLLAFLLVGVRIFGFQVFIVLSGSMEPTYQTGSVIYVKEVDPMTLKDGDPVTFVVEGQTIVTHRIVEVVADGGNADNQYFRTKGDANEIEDGALVACENVVGKPVFSVPFLGYLAAYIQEPPGMYIAVSAAAGLMLIVLLADSFLEEQAGPKPKKRHAQKKRRKEDGSIDVSDTSESPEETKLL